MKSPVKKFARGVAATCAGFALAFGLAATAASAGEVDALMYREKTGDFASEAACQSWLVTMRAAIGGSGGDVLSSFCYYDENHGLWHGRISWDDGA